MLIPNDNAPNLSLHDRLLHLFVWHFFQPIGSKHTTICQIDYEFMHQVQAGNKVNLQALIFQDLIKVIWGSIKTISYSMHISHIIRKVGCDVSMDPPL